MPSPSAKLLYQKTHFFSVQSHFLGITEINARMNAGGVQIHADKEKPLLKIATGTTFENSDGDNKFFKILSI